VKAGAGDEAAVKQIEGIKAAAAAGHTQWQQIKRNFDAVAKLVLAGKPKPSVFVPQARRASPLLPGGQARRGAPTNQAALIKKQAEQIRALKLAQIERAKKGALTAQTKARFEGLKAAHEVELQQYEDNLAAVQKALENRDIADDMRKKLEEQAEQYEALIEKMKTPTAANEPVDVVTPEGAEALADDAAEAYPSGAPGDTEFNDGGMG
jgi:hypothetical protein